VKTPAQLLDLPVQRTARWLALRFLDEAAEARARLRSGGDEDALHDFRVALRRLRSTLRAYRGALEGSVRGRDLRRVRSLARATGESRDAQVQAAWVRDSAAELAGDERRGAEWLLESLREHGARADKHLRREVRRKFARERRRLADRLSVYRVHVALDDPAGGPPASATLAVLASEAALELREGLARIRTIADQRRAHRVRIAAKRLRYLLEPFADELSGGADALKRLKALQDVLGDMHDAHVLLHLVEEATPDITGDDASEDAEHGGASYQRDDGDSGDVHSADSAQADVRSGDADSGDADSGDAGSPDGSSGDAERDGGGSADARHGDSEDADADDPRAGLRALTSRLEAARAEAFGQLNEEWLGGRSAGFFALVDGVVEGLKSRGGAGDREIERKYLLSAFPELPEGAVEERIEQGWVPGERLHERLRRISGASGDRFYRTVKLGSGISRTELEEETTADVFRHLWQLTEGRRVRKRRYTVPDGGLKWEIDRFADRDLVLAEIELPTEDAEVEIPAWLAPHVVREVTGEDEFVNINLAR
jgi:CHAD domain-containing protein/CYTH domain-containing protein